MSVIGAQGPTLQASAAQERFMLARCGMVLLILAAITMMTGAILAESLRKDLWAALGGGIGVTFWIAGLIMGLVSRHTLTGRVVMWMGGVPLVLALLMAIVYPLLAADPQLSVPLGGLGPADGTAP